MSLFVYMMSDYTKTHIHSGYCEDINKMILFYNNLNELSLHYPVINYLNRLVYLEEVYNLGQAIDRVTYFTHLPLPEKAKAIEGNNPEWIDLTTASNFDF